MAWILVIFLSGSAGATSQQIEMPTKEICQAASQELIKQKAPFDRFYAVCVQKKV